MGTHFGKWGATLLQTAIAVHVSGVMIGCAARAVVTLWPHAKRCRLLLGSSPAAAGRVTGQPRPPHAAAATASRILQRIQGPTTSSMPAQDHLQWTIPALSLPLPAPCSYNVIIADVLVGSAPEYNGMLPSVLGR